MNNVSVGSASVVFEQLSDQYVHKMSSKKKTAPKKISPKKTAPKKTAPKNIALKKKIATKSSAKVGERIAKKDSNKGKEKVVSKNTDEQAAGAVAKETPAVKEFPHKEAILDSSSGLCDMCDLSRSVPACEVIKCQKLYFLLCDASYF